MKTLVNKIFKINRVFFGIVWISLAGYRAIGQDTFSIVGLDSTSRQIGSAGASCLDLYFAGINDPAFLTDILPDTGVVNTQSYFIQANQDNARTRMRLGETPVQIINWLVANDANNNPQFKQYGIVAFNGNSPSSASHTGSTCINYKNHINGHINGFYYAIQGNILVGQKILDSMEARFRNTSGSLACRLMAAMQGAKVIGADTRCNNSSSLFAFMQVANPNDIHGNPSLNISLKTKQSDNVEPIDSLQKLFNLNESCSTVSIPENKNTSTNTFYPNPSNDFLIIEDNNLIYKIEVYNIQGQKLFDETYLYPKSNTSIFLDDLESGLYFVTIFNGKTHYTNRFIKQ
ncbi:MAG: DUF1028 domain-containing protein [Bacteroidia bacterium]|nr:DUF1028 domain-containing protein [Bacteroidia bacterium]